MANKDLNGAPVAALQDVSIVRHKDVCRRLQVSSAKLFDMIAKGIFPKPFLIVPNGRATGWLKSTVENWILNRHKGGV
jgi:predicted DNA-binding transcriptional regulator AlpA